MEEGYVKLNRCIRHNWLWKDNEPFDMRSAWIDLLLLASWKDEKRLYGGKLMVFKRGTVYKSMSELASRWQWHRTTVSRFLKLLESDNMVTVNATTHGTTITIVNWDFYQCDTPSHATTDAQQMHDSCTTYARQMHTIEECKEGKNILSITSSKDSVIDCPTETVRPTQNHSKDIEKIVDAWNSLSSVGIAKVSKVAQGSTRYTQLVGRISQYGVDEILTAITEITKSKFLQGKNNRGWMITFDWFIKPSNFPKVLEGNYSEKGGTETNDWSWLDHDSK